MDDGIFLKRSYNKKYFVEIKMIKKNSLKIFEIYFIMKTFFNIISYLHSIHISLKIINSNLIFKFVPSEEYFEEFRKKIHIGIWVENCNLKFSSTDKDKKNDIFYFSKLISSQHDNLFLQ